MKIGTIKSIYQPMVLDYENEGELMVIAEMVAVLG